MKKILPYILMMLAVANLFAPLSVGVDRKNNPQIAITRAEANGISLNVQAYPSDTLITVRVLVQWEENSFKTREHIIIKLLDVSGKELQVKTVNNLRNSVSGDRKQTGSVSFEGLTPSTKYQITSLAEQVSFSWWQLAKPAWLLPFSPAKEEYSASGKPDIDPIQISTLADGVKISPSDTQFGQSAISLEALMPTCGFGISDDSSVPGCAAQFIYYVLFVPTSYLFALAGQFFDFTFGYSVNDNSYRTPFIVQGWAIVRDFCNLFFIFVLLYVAFATILNLHGFKTKETIINVVIIGLLINFSLFATRLIIDTSNILARVFYNSETITITKGDANGVTNSTPWLTVGANGVLPLSAAIVNKVNPQNLIINGKDAVKIEDKVSQTGASAGTAGDLGAGAFILITLLAIAVNVVGMIVFLSVGLIFVARVIGLWVAMVLVPFAFFSYTVPSMQSLDTVGWKKWWPETLKLAFLAPIFIFFLYLIIKFLETGLSLIQSNTDTNGITFVLSIIVPFAFIMILLMKAKSIAKKMSGELGQSITGGISAIGGIALGGAALGTALLGRKTIGAFMKGASTGESANQRFAEGKSRGTWDKIKGATAHYGTFGLLTKAQKSVGSKLNKNQHEIDHAAHARHDLDTAANVVAPGKKWNELNGDQRLQARTNMERIVEMRNLGLGNKTWAQLSDADRQKITVAIDPRLKSNTTAADQTTIKDARRKQGLIENVIQSTVGGSFDVRNLSKLVAGEQDKGINKLVTGLTSALAGGMRNAFKQSNINYGVGQKDFLKDLGNTITEALKSAHIKADLSHVGEEKKEGDHGGGHH